MTYLLKKNKEMYTRMMMGGYEGDLCLLYVCVCVEEGRESWKLGIK